MNALAAFRRSRPEAAPADTLALLVSKRDALAARVATLRERAAVLDADETRARAGLEAAAAGGEETADVAEELAKLTARRGPLALEANAATSALAAAEAALANEETRLRELETDAKIAGLRAAEEEAEAAFRAALIAAGVSYENVLAAESALDRALMDSTRPHGHGFLDAGARSVAAAESEARDRARQAVLTGAAGGGSHLDHGAAVPFARLLPAHWR